MAEEHQQQVGINLHPVKGPDGKTWGAVTFVTPLSSATNIFPQEALQQIGPQLAQEFEKLHEEVKRTNMGLSVATKMPDIKKRI
jgi:hypothetical protein